MQREVWGEGETLRCCSPWGPCSPFEDPSALLGSCPGPRACGSSPARVGWGGDVLRGCRRDRARTFRAPQTTPHHRGHQGGRVVRTPSSVGSTLITFWKIKAESLPRGGGCGCGAKGNEREFCVLSGSVGWRHERSPLADAGYRVHDVTWGPFLRFPVTLVASGLTTTSVCMSGLEP